jgi:hypothetical protein
MGARASLADWGAWLDLWPELAAVALTLAMIGWANWYRVAAGAAEGQGA